LGKRLARHLARASKEGHTEGVFHFHKNVSIIKYMFTELNFSGAGEIRVSSSTLSASNGSGLKAAGSATFHSRRKASRGGAAERPYETCFQCQAFRGSQIETHFRSLSPISEQFKQNKFPAPRLPRQSEGRKVLSESDRWGAIRTIVERGASEFYNRPLGSPEVAIRGESPTDTSLPLLPPALPLLLSSSTAL